MTKPYRPQEIEPKWQQRWEADALYRSVIDADKPKFYALTMLPYPSGDLHIGHWYAMTPSDARARFKRMQGYNVLFPMGFDAFGLPAENAAIQRGIHPGTWTLRNVANMRQQMRTMGTMFDWQREAVSCLPGYYRWTEWLFLKLYEMGLAYRKKSPVDYCPSCKTTLAREQVVGEEHICERCGAPVIKKDLEQWFFRITKYADELLDFAKIDWPDKIRLLQTNWIGRSEGAEVTFTIAAEDLPANAAEGEGELVVFTTRPDTLWGATFMVLAPEHPLVERITKAEYRESVAAYKQQAARQNEIERLATDKEKTGVFTGAHAINPVNGARIPVWIADYVMMTYGTGAIMAVPAHDERDFAFAIKFGLAIIPVIARPDGIAKSFTFPGSVREGFRAELEATDIEFVAAPVSDLGEGLFVTLHGEAQIDTYIALMQKYLQPNNWNEVVGARWAFIFTDGEKAEVCELDSVEADAAILARCKAIFPPVSPNRTCMEMLTSLSFYTDVLFHHEYGMMINSGPFSGTPGDVAKSQVIAWLAEQGRGKAAINYKLRDWLISRQRYWGAPIPMIYCDSCGIVPVPYEDLPVLLPADAEIPKTGENALLYHEGYLHTTCPKCGRPARRETDTMDTFMCSSWYQYAYLSPYYREGESVMGNDTPWDPAELAYWAPVDSYTGGAEHAVMHLMYTRFFTKALRDAGLLNFDEPMLQYRYQGIILGEPRDGDCVEVSGTWEGNAFQASHIAVTPFDQRDNWPPAGKGELRVCGEVLDRDDVSLKVQAGDDLVVVRVPEELEIVIPGKESLGGLNDILYHLEVEKMSKSKKNVVAPDTLVATYGADTVRAYLMFGWRWDQGGPWDSKGIEGVVRWINRVWALVMDAPRTRIPLDAATERELQRAMHTAIKAVTQDLESFSFNTIIARLMEFTNALGKVKDAAWESVLWDTAISHLLLLLAPITPHLAEELWEAIGKPYSVHVQAWPSWDEAMLAVDEIEIPVQVNGKVRGKIVVAADANDETVKATALDEANVRRYTEGQQVLRVIVAGRKLVSVVVK
ncbi:MAG: class I tRNA ligase family protein [Anaerolineae bacterium]|jgi:leucyl-tRNA synthetase|nr:class I tRNA ligase family protein [Anaerolineae bacterium]